MFRYVTPTLSNRLCILPHLLEANTCPLCAHFKAYQGQVLTWSPEQEASAPSRSTSPLGFDVELLGPEDGFGLVTSSSSSESSASQPSSESSASQPSSESSASQPSSESSESSTSQPSSESSSQSSSDSEESSDGPDWVGMSDLCWQIAAPDDEEEMAGDEPSP